MPRFTHVLRTTMGALLLALAGLCISTLPTASAAGSGCDLVAAPNGADTAPGTVEAPLETAGELIDRLQTGETGCLRDGTYTDRQYRIKRAGVTLTSFPGERATLKGRVRLEHTADDSVIENLVLDGRNPDALLGPLVYADRAVLRNNEITNYNTAICVHVASYPGTDAPRGVVIEGNDIHDCGELPRTNKDHGIYLAHARETVIKNNRIHDNADRGIQMYPDADDSIITGNVIYGNGVGVLYAGLGPDTSDGNVVTGNVVADSKVRYNISTHWTDAKGSGNVARGNCVWSGSDSYGGAPSGSGVEPGMDGVSTSDNVIAKLNFADLKPGDFANDPSSPCGAELLGSATEPTDASGGSSGTAETKRLKTKRPKTKRPRPRG